MSFGKLVTFVFGIIFIILLYVIIYYALKIMYKDVKTGGKAKNNNSGIRYGIEVIQTGVNSTLEQGAVVPIRGIITLGRKAENTIVLTEPFVSGNHARIYAKNNNLCVEDLNSTNGVYVNNERIEAKYKLIADDKNIIRGIDDIISDNEEDILISHGSIIDDEISKKEDDYFSSLDSFNLALNKDFLFDEDKNEFDKSHDYDSGEIIKKASEDDVFDTEDLIDSELYDPEEKRPAMPEDYKDAEEKVRDNMTSNWKNILKAIKGEKFVNKNLDEMLDWIKEKYN